MLPTRRCVTFKFALSAMAVMLLTVMYTAAPIHATDTFVDSLRGTGLNPRAWSVQIVGGDIGAATPQADGLHLRLSSQGSGQDFGVVVRFRYAIAGDFDASVDYRTVAWPEFNGAGIRLGSVSIGSVERVSRRNWEQHPGENYLTNFQPVGQGVSGFTATSDTAGRLRLTRVGNTYAGYKWTGTEWTLINATAGSPTGTLTNLSLVLGSTDYGWTPQEKEVVLENFTIAADSLTPPPYSLFLPLVVRQ